MDERVLCILYGTQTGCSQEVAEIIARNAARYHFRSEVRSMQDFDVTELPSLKYVVFVCSTTGNGETPDSMKKFWRFLLRKDLPSDSLNSVSFSVFGLGDSSYSQFNVVGKRLYKRVMQLGANALCRRGDGDDQHPLGTDGDLISWMSDLFAALLTLMPIPEGLAVLPTNALTPPKYGVKVSSYDAQQEISNPGEGKHFSFEGIEYFVGRLIENTRITDPSHDQDVRHIELSISGSNFSYQPGDVAVILPKSRDEDVNRILSRLSWNGDWIISGQTIAKDVAALDIPFPCTLRSLLTDYIGISSTPKRYFFEILSHFAQEEREKERLLYFSSPEGREELVRYNDKEKRTCVEVLEDFPSVQFPIEYLFDILPRQKPRYFSISSAQKLRPHVIQMTVAVVKFRTPFKRMRTGLCSSWLSALDPSKDCVSVSVKGGSIRLPPNPNTPIIMVGPGTGLAPFRSFVEDLHAQSRKGIARMFFFGCRFSGKDWLYRDQMTMYEGEGTIGKYITAFSRDTKEKMYVQHRMIEHGQEIWKIIAEENGIFYLSGSANQMPKDVRTALRKIAQDYGGMSESDAFAFIKDLEYKARIQVEVWS
eukprot:TRINITY_DN4186_c0_g1_i2.p1 TRINITY_DN4186_c0_g1~~TRINITY_DN4186_c0_g1_i2.p1  ORF type:complete len:593 (+),score=121.84 TRINITY_DN4186_c0_g1_i2:58-1836(+)